MDVHDNTIRRSTRPAASRSGSFWAAIGIAGRTSGIVGQAELETRDRVEQVDEQATLLSELFGLVSTTVAVETTDRSYLIRPALGSIEVSSFLPGSVGVHGNVADSTGRGGAILVTAGACVVGDNRATFASTAEAAAAVVLAAGQVIANANQVVVSRRQVAIRIRSGPCTVLGNVTTGPIELNGAPLGSPWDALNA